MDTRPVTTELRVRRLTPAVLLALCFLTSLGGLHLHAQTGAPAPGAMADSVPSVGSQRCSSCHVRESDAWKGSQHARALQAASPGTVLGRFDGAATFDKDGVTTRFHKEGSRFLIDTIGPDGKPGTFEVKYTLGVEPLQQYLVALPGGRLQAFGIAWDSRSGAAGGQRWFDLYPGQKLGAGDPIHWTGIQQTANFMCVDCHVTNFRKGFDEAAGEYRSTWSEAGVGCEACHGAGGAHAADPRANRLPVSFPARAQIVWGTDPDRRPQIPAERKTVEVAACARCHARGATLADTRPGDAGLADGFHPSLLEPGLYHADGQMRDEVFNYGSFLQSRMFAKGVSCSDCHEPHGQKLRAEGNGVCEQCHAPARYAAREHHFHDPASKAGQCTSCHMPTVTYMVVDPRHDHSFRVPRPDLSAALGVPNACTACHADKPPQELAEALSKRLGHAPSGFQTFAGAFAAADRGAPGSADQLARIANDAAQPDIARASAIARAFGLEGGAAGIDLARMLADPDPLVRMASVEGLAQGDASAYAAAIAPLLHDKVRAVRIAAAHALAGPAEMRLPDSERAAFQSALEEYRASQRFNADRGEAHMNLALLEIRRGNGPLADDHLARAIAVDPTFVPAYVQLADLYRARRDEPKAAELLRQAVQRNPESAAAQHALGLSLVRQRDREGALAGLRRATELEPANARYAYVYAIALDQQDHAAAVGIVIAVLAQHPYDIEALQAAAIWAMRENRRDDALRHLRVLQSLRPGDPALAREIDRLNRAPR
jgi:tetratricopeptide (TPR) repeat protein